MTPFIIYLLKSSASITLFYILYKLVMSNDKTYKLNRFLLLAILFVSILIPFIEIPVLQEKPIVKQVEFVRDFFVPEIQTIDLSTPFAEVFLSPEKSINNFNPILFFYFLAIVFLFIKLLISVVRISQLMKKAEKQGFQQFVLFVVKEFIQPFSFLKQIFISEKDYHSNKEILIVHEAEHIRQKHYIDLFFVEIFALLHWFNPFMWLLKREIKLVHEYQADQAVLRKGIDAKKYQLLVLKKAVGERRFAMASYFTQKPILKRIKMMKKNKLNRWGGLKLLLFVPLIALLVQAFARPESLVEKAIESVPIIQQDNVAKWLERWTVDNIKHGVYQPDGLKSDDYPIIERNKLSILLTRNNDYIIENTKEKGEDIKLGIRSFIKGKNLFGEVDPEFQEKQLPLLGDVQIPKCIVRLLYDKASSVEVRNNSLQIIGKAYLEIRQEKAVELFNQDYFELEEEKRDIIDKVVPVIFGYSSILIDKPPPSKVLIELYEDRITFLGDIISFNELSKVIQSFSQSANGEGIISFRIEEGVSQERVNQIKEILREARIKHINVSDMKD